MKRLFVFLILFIMKTTYSQTYVNINFLLYTKQYAQKNAPYVVSTAYEVFIKNNRAWYYIVYYEPFFEHQVPAGDWTIFFLKKNYKGLENEPLFQVKNFNIPARKYINDLLMNNLSKLLEEFDVYVCQVRNEDLEASEEGTEKGEIITVYYPKDDATYYIYKYTPKGWLLISKEKHHNAVTRTVGESYLVPLALLKIYKYLWNKQLSEKYNQTQIQYVRQLISLIEKLSENIFDEDKKSYRRNYDLLKQKLDSNKIISQDSSILRLVYSVYAVDLIDRTLPFKNKRSYSQVRAAINTLFALNCYEFSNKEWLDIYKLFKWYCPQSKEPAFGSSYDILIKQLKKLRNKVKP